MAQQVFDRLFERVAGLDVHKAQVTAAVRVPDGDGGRVQHVAEFSTTVRGLVALRDWLEAHQITHLAMEATGVYWRPVWAILEDRFKCILVNPRDVKQVPGRKPMLVTRRGSRSCWRPGCCARASCHPSRSGRFETSRGIARPRSRSANARPTGCTRSLRTLASSWTASRRTSWASPGARCSTRSSPAQRTPHPGRSRLRLLEPGRPLTASVCACPCDRLAGAQHAQQLGARRTFTQRREIWAKARP